MHNFKPEITDHGPVRFIDWPAVTYVCRTDGQPIDLTNVDTFAVPFPRVRGNGELHHRFGLCDVEGAPKAYGLAVSVSRMRRAKAVIAATRIGESVRYKGKLYTVTRAPNNNVTLVLQGETP